MSTLTADEFPPELQREYRTILARCHPKDPTMHPKQNFRINFTFSQPTDTRGGRTNRNDSRNVQAANSSEAQRQFREDFEAEYEGCDLRSVTCIPVG